MRLNTCAVPKEVPDCGSFLMTQYGNVCVSGFKLYLHDTRYGRFIRRLCSKSTNRFGE